MDLNAAIYPSDQEVLDRAYSPSHLVESLDHYLEVYYNRSARTSGRLTGKKVSYGPDERQRLTFFNGGNEKAPLVLFIHGGFWSALDGDQFTFLAEAFNAVGLHYAALTYRLVPDVSLTDIVEDVVQSLKFLHDNAETLDIDPGKIVLVGHSAGAHLAAMMATRSDVVTPAGLMLVSGVFELGPVQASYVNDTAHITDAEVEHLSPARLRPVHTMPVYLAVGDIEPDAFIAQSELQKDEWPGCGLSVVSGRNHFDIVFDLADPETELFEQIQLMTADKSE